MNINLAKELNECYVEYINDFLTVERYASYKGWSLFFFFLLSKLLTQGARLIIIKSYSISFTLNIY